MLPEKMADQLKEAQEERQSLDAVWDMSNTFLWARQADNTIRSLAANPQQARALRVKAAMYNPNLLVDYYRTAMSRMCVKQPSATILPTTASTEDIAKALAAQEALVWLWWGMGIEPKWNKALPYLLTKGNVGFRCFWDDAGQKTDMEVFRPEDIFYEPGTRDPSETEWIAQRKRVTRSALIDQFPDHKEIINEACQEDPEQGSFLGISMPWTNANKKLKNRAEVYFVYARDGSGDYGIFLGGGNETWLWEGKLPDGVQGIHHLVYTVMPDSPWGMGLIENLMSPQAAYNKGRKQQMDHIDLVNKPKVLIPFKSDVAAGAFNDVAGQKIRYKQGYKPEYMTGPSWPTGAERNLDRIRGEMNDLAGMQNTSLGKQEGAASSGVAIRSLAAQDINKLQTTQDNVENCFAAVFKDALILMKAHMTQARAVRMFDVFGSPIFANIDATSLTDDPDIRIDAGSMFTIRAAEHEERLLSLLEAGLVTPDDVASQISLQSGRKAKLEEMRDLTHAREVLEIAKRGVLGRDPETGATLVMDITIYAYDNLAAFRQVFGEFVRDVAAFYTLAPDRQTMIHDIYLAVCAGPLPGQIVVYPKPDVLLPSLTPDAGAAQPAQNPQQARGAPRAPRGTQARMGTSPMPVQTPQAEEASPAPGGEAM